MADGFGRPAEDTGGKGESDVKDGQGFGRPISEDMSKDKSSEKDDSYPEWAIRKFWADGKPDIERQSRAHVELEGTLTRANQENARLRKEGGVRLGTPSTEKPQTYWETYDGKWLSENVAEDVRNKLAHYANDHDLQAFMEAGHDEGVPADVLHRMYDKFGSRLAPHLPDVKTPEEAHQDVVKYLGPRGQETYDAVDSWLKTMKLREDHYPVLDVLARTGAGVDFLDMLREKALGGGPVSTESQATGSDRSADRARLREDMKDEKNWKDPVKREAMMAEHARLAPPGYDALALAQRRSAGSWRGDAESPTGV